LGTDGTNPATNFIGTTDNQALVLRTANARSLRIEPSSETFGSPALPITRNMIGGSHANEVTAGVRGATIAGGGLPTGNSDPTVLFDGPNQVTSHYGTVSGGYANTAGDGTSLGGGFTTVAGGINNVASADLGVVGGGSGNRALGSSSTIAGGQSNIANGFGSAVAGGSGNTAGTTYSFVSGGSGNCAGAPDSWAGGTGAKVRPGTTSGSPGGPCTGISAPSSAGDRGTFSWADSQSGSFTSTGPNQFLIRSAGGMAINSNTPSVNTDLTLGGSGNLVMRSTSASTGVLSFGSQTRQMLNLFGSTYGIGVQSARLYQRTDVGGGFNWFVGGSHSDTTDNPGTGGAWRMHLGSVGNLLTSTGTIGTLSDARLKNQVHGFSGALDRINALRPVNYHYVQGGKAAFQPAGEQVGFIAQELQQVFPDWVLQGDDGYLQLSMRGFEAVAVRGMQELSAENAELRDELKQLRLQNAHILQRLQAIEAR